MLKRLSRGNPFHVVVLTHLSIKSSAAGVAINDRREQDFLHCVLPDTPHLLHSLRAIHALLMLSPTYPS
jgi:hypothetical protein